MQIGLASLRPAAPAAFTNNNMQSDAGKGPGGRCLIRTGTNMSGPFTGMLSGATRSQNLLTGTVLSLGKLPQA